MALTLPYFFSVVSRRAPYRRRVFLPPEPPLSPGSVPGRASHTCPHSSVTTQYRNLHLLSIGYGSRPRLRPRLTQSRSALLWKPWIFGRKDSHLSLATHSGILSAWHSTAPYRYSFAAPAMLLYQYLTYSSASAVCFSPGHFRRRTSRPVSYYALFE